MCRRNARSIAKIGEGARHFQHPLTRAPRESKAVHRGRKQALSCPIGPAPALHIAIRQPGVARSLSRKLQTPRP
jgi:hypothetical protein